MNANRTKTKTIYRHSSLVLLGRNFLVALFLNICYLQNLHFNLLVRVILSKLLSKKGGVIYEHQN